MPKKTSSAKKRVSKRKKSATKASKTSGSRGKVKKVMREYKEGSLHSGSKRGPKVKSRKQAIAIALSEGGVSKKRSPSKRASKKSSRR